MSRTSQISTCCSPFVAKRGLRAFTQSLSAIEARAPMRLDGELTFGDGLAISWRELHAGTRDIGQNGRRRLSGR